MNIGDNIKRIRLNRNLTQDELATKSGFSKNAIWNYENNKRQPTVEFLTKIANALDVSINDLIGYNELQKQKFEEDFDISMFEPRVMEYINDLKQILKNTFPGAKINNTLVIQNIIINIMAEESAKSAVGMDKPDLMLEFAVDKTDMITGKQLYDQLYSMYLKKYEEERNALLKKYSRYFPEENIPSEY